MKEWAINFVREQDDAFLLCCLSNAPQFTVMYRCTGGIVRIVYNDHLCVLSDEVDEVDQLILVGNEALFRQLP